MAIITGLAISAVAIPLRQKNLDLRPSEQTGRVEKRIGKVRGVDAEISTDRL